MKEKVDRRVIKTKNSIRRTFLELLNQKEFEKISVTEIAKVADIDRKTFYLHYANTAELLDEFERELLEEALEKLNEQKDFSIEQLFKSFNEIFEKNSPFFQHILKTEVNLFFLKKCENIIVEMLNEKIVGGKMEENLEISYHISFIASGLITLYSRWVRNDQGMSIDDLSQIAMKVVGVNFDNLFRLV